jgi:hypothetical protein
MEAMERGVRCVDAVLGKRPSIVRHEIASWKATDAGGHL